MMHRNDSHTPDEVDSVSQTRFGPRPVPDGEPAARKPAPRKLGYSRVIPSGPVSPDGRSAYPAPSTAAKIVVWGGIAAGVAGLTAATIAATRKVASMIADDSHPSGDHRRDRVPLHDRRAPETLAPRFAELDEEEREAIRRRARAQARDDSRSAANHRAKAATRRGPRRNAAVSMTRTATDLSDGLNNLVSSLNSAFAGFRSVAAQAGGIIAEFAETAEHVRKALGLRGDGAQHAEPTNRSRQSGERDVGRPSTDGDPVVTPARDEPRPNVAPQGDDVNRTHRL